MGWWVGELVYWLVGWVGWLCWWAGELVGWLVWLGMVDWWVGGLVCWVGLVGLVGWVGLLNPIALVIAKRIAYPNCRPYVGLKIGAFIFLSYVTLLLLFYVL